MYICIYIIIYICVCVCVCVYIYIGLGLYMYIQRECMSVLVRVYAHVYKLLMKNLSFRKLEYVDCNFLTCH